MKHEERAFFMFHVSCLHSSPMLRFVHLWLHPSDARESACGAWLAAEAGSSSGVP
jgi:hypothetical protein